MGSRTAAICSLLAAAALAGGAGAQAARRGVPQQLRSALIGCHALPGGETMVIEPQGATGLRSRHRVTGRRGALETYSGSMYYRPTADAVEGGCGARSQHGQFCLFRLDASGALEVTRVARRSGRTTLLEHSACAPGTDVPVVERAPAPIPADAPAAQLLGARRRDIHAGRTPTREEAAWTRYSDELSIQYEMGIAMRVRLRVGDVSCQEAATLAGYPPRRGSAPLRRSDGCEWPGTSERHRIGRHAAASFSGGVIELRVQR